MDPETSIRIIFSRRVPLANRGTFCMNSPILKSQPFSTKSMVKYMVAVKKKVKGI
jgi:hypothetical protein